MTAGDVFFNPIKTSPKQRSSVLGELSHGPLGFQFRLDGLQAPEFSYEIMFVKFTKLSISTDS